MTEFLTFINGVDFDRNVNITMPGLKTIIGAVVTLARTLYGNWVTIGGSECAGRL